MCVEEEEGWCGGGGRKRQDRQGGERMEAEVMDSNEMKCWEKSQEEKKKNPLFDPVD